MEKNKMLIDATHPEETRVVVLKGGRVEEFDYESAARKLLRGNIYLAKVTRVEPSLQAAFVDYGGNRHGFLAFSEIHPDYYQIPFADRQALLDEEAEEEARAEREADARAERRSRTEALAAHHGHEDEAISEHEPEAHAVGDRPDPADSVALPQEADGPPPSDPNTVLEAPSPLAHELTPPELGAPAETVEPAPLQPIEHAHAAAHEFEIAPVPTAAGRNDDVTADAPLPRGLVEDEGIVEIEENGNGAASPPEAIEPVGSEDALEEVPERPRRRIRQYKIQEVIKRRQIILVQVVKEERGSKGAALTTYLSLAGRYTVLMPNTARGGGISRKITNPQDRKRLKAIASELEVPEGMGLIIRTAGAARTKQEIRRDFEYLLRLWESVREVTLASTAPCLVYEEGNLIKRSLRDLYTKDIDQVLVAGEAAYREAHTFMGMLMPSNVDSVIHYREPEPLFARYQIERQLNAMFSPYVTLRSGGYLVINQTEALVAIDVNSGKSTREFSIEETALSTNLEAADEIARQLKLRDLAGLIVIDFIDMEEKRNNRAVERRLKEALRHDRARIQIGHISHFGLLEMSRQRLRTGVLEGSTSQCPHCQGTGIIRSTESVALAVLRGIEDHLMKGPVTSISVLTTPTVALYILNHKRAFITDIEHRYGISVIVQASDRMQGAAFAIERTSGPAPASDRSRPEHGAVSMEWGFDGTGEEDIDEDEEPREQRRETAEQAGGELRSRSRRRRRGRGRRDDRLREEAPRERADDEREGLAVDRAEWLPSRTDHAAAVDGAPEQLDPLAAAAEDLEEEARDGAGNGFNGETVQKSTRRRRRGRRGGRSRGRDNQIAGVAPGSPADPTADQPTIDPDQLPPGRWSQELEPIRRVERVAVEEAVDQAVAPASPGGEVPSPTATVEVGAALSAEVLVPSEETRPRPIIVADSAHQPPLAMEVRPLEPVAPSPPPLHGLDDQPLPRAGEPQSDPAQTAHAGTPLPRAEELQPVANTVEQAPPPPPAPEVQEPPRKGWWQRRFST